MSTLVATRRRRWNCSVMLRLQASLTLKSRAAKGEQADPAEGRLLAFVVRGAFRSLDPISAVTGRTGEEEVKEGDGAVREVGVLRPRSGG